MHQNYNWFNHKSSILHHWLMAQLVEHQIQELKILRGRGFGSLRELCSKNGIFFYKLRTKISLSPEQRLACLQTNSPQQSCKSIAAIVGVIYYVCKSIATVVDDIYQACKTNYENRSYILTKKIIDIIHKTTKEIISSTRHKNTNNKFIA